MAQERLHFSVVEFTSEGTVEAVPSSWVAQDNKTCFWPPVSGPRLLKLLQDTNIVPAKTWKSCPVRVFKSYANYASARKAAKVAESQSALESSAESELNSGRQPKAPVKLQDYTNNDKLESSSDEETNESPTTTVNCTRTPANNLHFHVLTDIPTTPLFQAEPIAPANNLDTSVQDLDFEPPQPTGSGFGAPVSIVSAEEFQAFRQEFQKFQKVVFRKLENIAEDVRDVRRITTESSSHEAAEAEDFSALPKLPVNTSADIKAIEEWSELPDNYVLMVKFLSRLGGTNLQKIVHGILKRIFDQEISEKINFTGRNGKIAFQPMKFRQIILDATRKTKQGSRSEEREVDDIVSKWFQFAKDRNGGRAKRQKMN